MSRRLRLTALFLLLLLGLPGGPASAQPEPARRSGRALSRELGPVPSRRDVVRRAESYARHSWKATGRNALHGVDRDGVHVDTPDRVEGGWRVGANRGVPYCWGGSCTLAEFDRGVREGKAAGFVFEDGRQNHPRGSRCAVGVDCSGLVSRCWGLPQHVSTAKLPEISVPLRDYSELRPGDILNKAGSHVMIFTGFAGPDRSRARVIEAISPKVTPGEYSLASLAESGYLPRRDARRHAPRGMMAGCRLAPSASR